MHLVFRFLRRAAQGFPLALWVLVSSAACGSDPDQLTGSSGAGLHSATGLVVAPDTITLAPGEVYLLTAGPREGETLDGPVEWSASAGAIDPDGWFRAPLDNGTYEVVAAAPDGRRGQAIISVLTPAEPYFQDNFDACVLTRSAPFPGFGWLEARGGASDERPVVTRVIARSGGCSLRFRFAAGGAGRDAWSEQRFRLGRRLTEVYLQWYQYWPSGRETPSVGPRFQHRKVAGPNNNKFLRLWDDDYTDYRVKLGFSTLPKPGGDSHLITEYGTNRHGMGATGAKGDGEAITDGRRGRWVKIQVHVRLASAGNNDGVIELWVDGVRTISNTGLPLYPGSVGSNFLRNGYLLGWANSGFAHPSATYIDDVIIAGYPIP